MVSHHHGCCNEEACCLPDGTCADLSRAECLAQGGTPQGCGTKCADPDIDCAIVQACCLPDGSCLDLPPAECVALGGTPQGKGTECALTDCNQNPCILSDCEEAGCLDILTIQCDLVANMEVFKGCDEPPIVDWTPLPTQMDLHPFQGENCRWQGPHGAQGSVSQPCCLNENCTFGIFFTSLRLLCDHPIHGDAWNAGYQIFWRSAGGLSGVGSSYILPAIGSVCGLGTYSLFEVGFFNDPYVTVEFPNTLRIT